MSGRRIATLVAAALLAPTFAPVAAEAASLAMLDQLMPGAWRLQERDSRAGPAPMCLKSVRALIQLRHPGIKCEHFVIDDTPTDITVQYTCAEQGSGWTHIHRETDALIQIETQGVAGGLPYYYAAEGRRQGDCPK